MHTLDQVDHVVHLGENLADKAEIGGDLCAALTRTTHALHGVAHWGHLLARVGHFGVAIGGALEFGVEVAHAVERHEGLDADAAREIAPKAVGLVGKLGGASLGAKGGAVLGAMVGTGICPGLGTVIGGALGSIGGSVAGSLVGQYCLEHAGERLLGAH